MHPDKFMWNEKGEIIYQGKTFYGSNMRNLISDVVTNRTKPSSQTCHESAFVKALADLDFPKDLVKNMKHLQMIEVYKNKKNHKQRPLQGHRGGKNGCPQPLDIVSFILLYSTIFFSLSFVSSLAVMSDILSRLCDFLKKCVIHKLLLIIVK